MTGLQDSHLAQPGIGIVLRNVEKVVARPRAAEIIGDAYHLYVGSLMSVAFSHMYRQLRTIIGRAEFSSSADMTGLAADLVAEDPYRSGMHIVNDDITSYGLTLPEARDVPEWYEDEHIFLRVTRPAQPTTEFMSQYLGFYNELFDPGSFTSVVPRLKPEAW